MSEPGPITILLQRLSAGEARTEAELRAFAARYLRGERAVHALSPTALVHEARLRLDTDGQLAPSDRRRFFAIAARRMRQVLVDHARHRDATKHGGAGREAVTLSSLIAEDSATASTCSRWSRR